MGAGQDAGGGRASSVHAQPARGLLLAATGQRQTNGTHAEQRESGRLWYLAGLRGRCDTNNHIVVVIIVAVAAVIQSDDQRVANTVPLGPEVGRIGTVIARVGDNAKRARREVEIQRTGTGPLNGVGGAISTGACAEDLITVDIKAVGELCLFEQILKGQQDR